MSTIVVADDEREIRDLLVYALERDGHAVHAVADGPSALRAARSGADALILDLGLPSSTAWRSCELCAARGMACRC